MHQHKACRDLRRLRLNRVLDAGQRMIPDPHPHRHKANKVLMNQVITLSLFFSKYPLDGSDFLLYRYSEMEPKWSDQFVSDVAQQLKALTDEQLNAIIAKQKEEAVKNKKSIVKETILKSGKSSIGRRGGKEVS